MEWVFPLPYGAQLVISVDAKAALDMLAGYEARMKDLHPLLDEIADFLRACMARRFSEGGNPPWQPLAASTMAARRMAGNNDAKGKASLWQRGGYGSASILLKTGALRDSYADQASPAHIEEIDESKASVSVGSRHRLAKIHQKGTHPYTIRAKIAKALAFTGGNGETLLRASVQHPGLAARPVTITKAEEAEMAKMVRRHFSGTNR